MILFEKGWTFPLGSAIMIVDKISGTPPFQFSDEKRKVWRFMLKLTLDRDYKAAIYLRLSKEDGDFSFRGSNKDIKN